MKENQQRRADQVLRDYPPVASCERREGFARHVERWFVGR
jgi:hypothetical protein